MSLITNNFNIDENATEKLKNMKNIGVAGIKAELTKRAALGDLQNRALPRGLGKDAAAVIKKDAKMPDMRAVKPRVDTYRKKDTGIITSTVIGTTTTTSSIAVGKTTRTGASSRALQPAADKILTRSNSVRLPATKTTTTNTLATSSILGGIQKQASNSNGPTQTKETKTLTTKLVESKLQQVKINKKEKTHQGEPTTLRREDSNLSRKSLTKLKAVLTREVKVTSTKTSSTGGAIVAAAAASKVQQKSSSSEQQQKTHAEKTKIIKSEINLSSVVKQSDSTGLRIVKVESKSSDAVVPLNKNIRNIDEGDKGSLILVSEYVNDIYEYLFQLEIEQSVRKNHLAEQKMVTPRMRAVLLDWINEVHSQFQLVNETFHMTVGIIDRYLQLVNDTKRTHLQLVGVTALFLAAKYEELYPPEMCDFIFMTDHSYVKEQILEMEIQIFRTLGCNLSRPVSIQFLRRFSKAADIEDAQHAMSKYFLELAAIEYDLASYRPSEIAAASLFLTLHLFKDNPEKATGFNNSLWNPTLQHYSHYTADHLRPITRQIAAVARNAPEAKLNAVYNKYQLSKLYKASLRSELYSPLMDSIINSGGDNAQV